MKPPTSLAFKRALIGAAIAAFLFGLVWGANAYEGPMMLLGDQVSPNCSAWAASPRHSDGWAYGVTAWHCQDGEDPLLRLNERGKVLSHEPIKWVAVIGDVLVFRFKPAKPMPYYQIAKTLPKYFSKIVGKGFVITKDQIGWLFKPLNLPGFFAGDTIRDGADEYITAWMPVQKGMSGGPVGDRGGIFGVIGLKFPSGIMAFGDVRSAPALIEAERQCRLNKWEWDYERHTCQAVPVLHQPE